MRYVIVTMLMAGCALPGDYPEAARRSGLGCQCFTLDPQGQPEGSSMLLHWNGATTGAEATAACTKALGPCVCGICWPEQ